MNREKIMVTGGAGFFGGHICEYFINDNKNVVLVDVLNSETTEASYKKKTLDYLKQLNRKNKNSNFSYYICDITNEVELTKIIIDEKPTIVIHAAALVMDRASVNSSLEFINVNVLGSQILINALSKLDTVKKIIFISSRSAVGEVNGAKTEMYEEDLFRPVNPYGASKAAGEHFFHSFHHIYKVSTTILRMNPMYGPRCRHDMFVWRLFNSIISGQKIEKYGSGEAVRDWLYVKDAVDAISKDILNVKGFNIMNLGTGVGTTTNQLINMVEQVADKKVNVVEVAPVVGDAHFGGIANCDKAKKNINWEAKTSLYDGLVATYDYMLNESKNN